MLQTLVWASLIIVPTAISFDYGAAKRQYEAYNATFQVQHIIDGGGPLGESWMFYGVWPNILYNVYCMTM